MRSWGVVAALVAATTLAVGGADADAAPVAHGRAGSEPWTLTASARIVGPSKIPSLCFSFLWAWGPGQPIANGWPTCISPASGRQTAHGTQWYFDIDVASHWGQGVQPFAYSGNGIRGLIILADPKTTRLKATLSDGEVVQLHARPLPAQLHRAAAIAWNVTHDRPRKNAVAIRKVIAYDAHGGIIGHYDR